MKHLFLMLSLAAAAVIANADNHGDKKAEKFEERKQEQLANIAKREAAMAEHKACITAAKTPEEKRACNEKMREEKMEMRKEHMAKREEHMEKRQEHMEKRKERMEKREERMEDKKSGM
jgi:hypothetical protein